MTSVNARQVTESVRCGEGCRKKKDRREWQAVSVGERLSRRPDDVYSEAVTDTARFIRTTNTTRQHTEAERALFL